MPQFDNVSVKKAANVYFDGKCISHTVLFADGSHKTVGVIFPSTLVFKTGAPETMEINSGTCKIRLAGESNWKTYASGQAFDIPGNSQFEIETITMLDYVCHFN